MVLYLTQLAMCSTDCSYYIYIHDAQLDLCSGSLNPIYSMSEAQGEQSDQTSAGDEEEAPETKVRR